MTKEEFMDFIEEQKKSGKSEEDITKIFCLMFQEGELDRKQFEAVLAVMGYELSDEYKSLSDDELKEKVLVKNDDSKPEEGADVKGAMEDKNGEKPPKAPQKGWDESESEKDEKDDKEEKPEEDDEEEEEEEESFSEKDESKSEPEDGKEEEDEEWGKAKKLFGFKD